MLNTLCRFMVLVTLVQTYQCDVKFQGHLQSLGLHHPAEGNIVKKKFLIPSVFYKEFVNKQQPVLISGLLEKSKPLMLWSDPYLKDNFGDEVVFAENTKIENRLIDNLELTLAEFLSEYNQSSKLYLIMTLPKKMQQEFPFPYSLCCESFMNRLQDFVLWFSGGNTKSYLHYDNVENLYCQIDGSKEWFLVDPLSGSRHIVEDHPEGQYSSVNVSGVDMIKYPGMQDLPWWKSTTYPGDCIYVPVNWWHQVSSPIGRNMAVNIWWAPMTEVPTPVSLDVVNKHINLASLHFNHGEWIRWSLAVFLKKNDGKVVFGLVKKMIIHEHTGENLVTEDSFQLLDSNSDGFLDLKELLDLSPETIHAAVQNVEIGAMNTNGLSKTEDMSDTKLPREDL